MKRTVALLLAGCLLIGGLSGCGARPSVRYDADTQTVYVRGVQDYDALSLPDEINDARVLEVEDNGFQFRAYLVMMRRWDYDVQTQLPGLIGRTKNSIAFLQQYLRDNAGAAYPAERAELPVTVNIDNSFVRKIDAERITLTYGETGTHREYLYLLALMDGIPIGWEQLGYVWYVGTCIDPYNEAVTEWPLVPELPYYSQCIAAGVDPDNVTAADCRTMYDACSRVCFEKGLDHWGSYCESLPVTREDDFSRVKDMEAGDTMLSAFMAASFLARLDELYGFEQVSLFCFGHKTFDEAFGTDFDSAYRDWHTWIRETYPASQRIDKTNG